MCIFSAKFGIIRKYILTDYSLWGFAAITSLGRSFLWDAVWRSKV